MYKKAAIFGVISIYVVSMVGMDSSERFPHKKLIGYRPAVIFDNKDEKPFNVRTWKNELWLIKDKWLYVYDRKTGKINAAINDPTLAYNASCGVHRSVPTGWESLFFIATPERNDLLAQSRNWQGLVYIFENGPTTEKSPKKQFKNICECRSTAIYPLIVTKRFNENPLSTAEIFDKKYAIEDIILFPSEVCNYSGMTRTVTSLTDTDLLFFIYNVAGAEHNMVGVYDTKCKRWVFKRCGTLETSGSLTPFFAINESDGINWYTKDSETEKYVTMKVNDLTQCTHTLIDGKIEIVCGEEQYYCYNSIKIPIPHYPLLFNVRAENSDNQGEHQKITIGIDVTFFDGSGNRLQTIPNLIMKQGIKKSHHMLALRHSLIPEILPDGSFVASNRLYEPCFDEKNFCKPAIVITVPSLDVKLGRLTIDFTSEHHEDDTDSKRNGDPH